MTLTGGNGVGVSPGNTFGGAVYNQGVLTLTNMVITGNSAGSDGGGVYNSTSDSLTIVGSTITNNTATSQSGGVHTHTSSTCSITDSIISNNTAGTGGGIYAEDGATFSLTRSTVSGNQATKASSTEPTGGGGIAADSITFTMTDSTVSGNSAANRGGGITFDIDTTATILRSTVSGNTAATQGGGMHIQADSNNLITIENSTISGNMAAGGGGLYRAPSAALVVTLTSTTVANNTATETGGGVVGTMNAGNTLIGNNTDNGTAPDYAGTVNSQGYNLIEKTTGTTISGTTTGNITGLDARVGPLQDNSGVTLTHALLPGSPALDKGSSSGTDQRGETRPFDYAAVPNAAGGDGADIGAIEMKLPLVVGALSRKMHGAAGTFDINLLTATGIECRTGAAGGNYQVIVTFANPVTVSGLSIMSSDGMAGGTQSVNGAVVTVDLTAVANAQTVGITLINVNDGSLAGDVLIPMGVLAGDTTGNGSVSASDIGQVKGQSGQAVTAANFRTDVNAGGTINASDIGLVKARSGTQLP
jgi:parallel beta-helix repeat protein